MLYNINSLLINMTFHITYYVMSHVSRIISSVFLSLRESSSMSSPPTPEDPDDDNNMISQTGAPGKHFKDQRFTYWHNHNKVVKHINSGKGAELDIINSTLFSVASVTEDHMEICRQILNDAITVDMPYPNTSKSIAFTEVGGSANSAQSKLPKVPGCYLISHEDRSYIGQAVHLGKRVREHAAMNTTSSLATWIGSVPQEVKVTLYRLPAQDSFKGLNVREFLCVLELYLFLDNSGTTENKSYVPTAGVMNTPETLAKHLALVGVAVFIYRQEIDGTLTYLYHSLGMRVFAREFGVGKSYVGNIMSRGGWYRSTMLFSKVDLLPGSTPTMTLSELKAYHTTLGKTVPRSDNPQIMATHKVTGEALRYSNRIEMKKALGDKRREYAVQAVYSSTMSI
jgi:hypothetical protein